MVGSLDERIAQGHPIRRIKGLADRALTQLGEVFDGVFSAPC
jgi:hypothetical protein